MIKIKAVGEWMRQGWRERGIDFVLDMLGLIVFIVGFAMAACVLAR